MQHSPLTLMKNHPSLNKHHTYWGEQDKAKGMDAYSGSSTLYIMYSTISKHNASLQQQEQVPISIVEDRTSTQQH